MIGDSVFERLKSTVPSVSDRVYRIAAPETVNKPYITFMMISTSREYTHDGYTGLQISVFRISVFAYSMQAVEGVIAQVLASMEAWKTAAVSSAHLQGGVEQYEVDTGLFHKAFDIIGRHY